MVGAASAGVFSIGVISSCVSAVGSVVVDNVGAAAGSASVALAVRRSELVTLAVLSVDVGFLGTLAAGPSCGPLSTSGDSLSVDGCNLLFGAVVGDEGVVERSFNDAGRFGAAASGSVEMLDGAGVVDVPPNGAMGTGFTRRLLVSLDGVDVAGVVAGAGAIDGAGGATCSSLDGCNVVVLVPRRGGSGVNGNPSLIDG